MIAVLMMSVKLAAPGHVKTKIFSSKCYGVIISVNFFS